MGVLRDKSYLHKELSLESLHTQEVLGFKLLNSTMFPEASSSVVASVFPQIQAFRFQILSDPPHCR